MHSHLRAAHAAVDAVFAGKGRAEEYEGQHLDFKEEPGTVRDGGRRVPIAPKEDSPARALAREVCCLANTTDGGVLVVGVYNKGTGREAFKKTYLDLGWLRERLNALTIPSASVGPIEERLVAGQRIYFIVVPNSIAETRMTGESALRTRVGDECVELSGDDARRFLEFRRRYDWSENRSGYRFSEAAPVALDLAMEDYRQEHGRVPSDALALLRQLGLTVDDTVDPELNNAGALLLCSFDRGATQIQALFTRVEGAPAYQSIRASAPLLVAFHDVDKALLNAFRPEHIFVGFQRRELRAVPRRAFREALVNAITHRDYRLPNGRVDVWATGDPPNAVKVQSTGGFPLGVPADRLLTTPSRPRNPRLAQAMHTLGLAEVEGIGIDSLYLLMLRDGHEEPQIDEVSGDVVCHLHGGQVDRPVRDFFDDLSQTDPLLDDDVRAHIAITALIRATPLRPEALAGAAQCGLQEATNTLVRLEKAGAVERLVNGSWSFRLTRESRTRLRSRLQYPSPSSFDEHWDMVRAYLDTHPDIGRDRVADLLGVKAVMASRVLSRLYNERGVIEPVGKARGPGVRYRLTT